MCKSSHYVGVVYLDGLKISAGASQEQIFQKIACEFENRFLNGPDKVAQAKSVLEACRIAQPVNTWDGEYFYKFGKYHGETIKDLESLDSAWIRAPKKNDGDIEFTGKLAVLVKIDDWEPSLAALACGAIAHC